VTMATLRTAAERFAQQLRGRNLGDQIRRNALLISTVTLAVSLISCFILVRHYALKHMDATFQAEADIRATRLEVNIDERLRLLTELARNPLITNALSDSQGRVNYVNPYLKEMTRSKVGFSAILLVDLRGRVLAGSETSTPLASPVLDQQSLAILESGRQVADVETSAESRLVIGVPVAFSPAGGIEAALVAWISLTPLLEQSLLPKDGRIAFSLRDGLDREVAGIYRDANDVSRRVSVAHPLQLQQPMAGLGLSVITTMDGSKAAAVTESLGVAFLLAGIAALAITSAIASRLARSISDPVVRLDETARRIANEGGVEMAGIPQVGHGEVASLSESLGKMAASLSNSRQKLEDTVRIRTRELQEANAMLDRVLQSAQDAIWEYSVEAGRLVFMSEGARHIVGKDPASLMAHPWRTLVRREDRHRFMQTIAAMSSGLTQAEIDCGIAGPRGETRMLRHRMLASFDHDGRLMKIDGMSTDITDKLQREAEFRQHAERLESIFSLSPDGYAIFDQEGKITFANTTFREIAQLGPQHIGTMTLAELSGSLRARANTEEGFPDIEGTANARSGDSLASDSNADEQLLHIRTPEPRVLQLAMRQGPTRTIARVLYVRDITREAEVDRMKSEFLSTAAHELRTPMSSVLGFSQLLLTRELDPEIRKEIYGTIYEQSTRLAGLLDELLDLARIEARAGKDFHIVNVPLKDVVEKTIAGILVPGDKRTISVVPPTDWPEVKIDPAKFQQALTNVISNAYKYSPEGGDIHLRVLVQEAQIVLEIEDHGIGMTPAQLRRAFERFYRADTTGKIPGTGLGLSLVKEIMELHGGSCSITSKPGEGTVVSLTLPAGSLASHGGTQAEIAPAVAIR
jgi:signal transduction histidine kinase